MATLATRVDFPALILFVRTTQSDENAKELIEKHLGIEPCYPQSLSYNDKLILCSELGFLSPEDLVTDAGDISVQDLNLFTRTSPEFLQELTNIGLEL